MAFFIVTVVVILNLIIAFVIEAFVIAVDHSKSVVALQQRLNSLLKMAQDRTPGPHPSLYVRPSTRLFKLYVDIFKDGSAPDIKAKSAESAASSLRIDDFHQFDFQGVSSFSTDERTSEDEAIPLLSSSGPGTRVSIERLVPLAQPPSVSAIEYFPQHPSNHRLTTNHPLFGVIDHESSDSARLHRSRLASMTRLLSLDEIPSASHRSLTPKLDFPSDSTSHDNFPP